MKKLLLLLVLVLTLTINYTFAIQQNDTLLDCEFLFNENIAESIFTWLIKDVPLVKDFIPEADFFQMYKTEKKTYCEEITNSEELTKTEKKVRIAQLYNLDSREFKFGIIDSYHKNLKIENLTFGNEISSNTIKDAGYKFITLNPSVLINNTIFISPKTNSVRSYHFDIDTPENFIATSYPDSLNGFCKIIHDDIKTKIKETIFFNTELLHTNEKTLNGKGKFEEVLITDIETSIKEGEITINSNLEIENSYRKKVSVWHPYCCASGEHGCIQYCYDCKEHDIELINDKVIITDNYYVTRYTPKIQKDYDIWHEDGLLWIRFYIDDINKYKRVMIDRFLEMDNYFSIIRYKFEPFDFLYFEAVPTVENSFTRLGQKINETIPSRLFYYKSPFLQFEENSVLIGTDQVLDKVNIEFETFFDSEGFFNWGNEKLTYSINLTQKEIFRNVILKTNQVFYWENETIEVTPIILTNKGMYIDDMTISYIYGDEKITKPARTNETIEFKYKQEGIIILEYPGDSNYYKTIKKQNIVRRPFILYYLFKLIGL